MFHSIAERCQTEVISASPVDTARLNRKVRLDRWQRPIRMRL